MSETNPTHAEQLDLLISRIVGADASAQDWSAFNTLAEKSPEAWKLLAQAQRDNQSLSLAVGVALHAADRVELPSREVADRFLRGGGRDHAHSEAWRRVRSVGGWAVAAMLALAMIGNQQGVIRLGGAAPANTAGISIPAGYFKVASDDDALQLYREKARQSGRDVVGEMPVLLESRPSTTGKGFEVIYVRQFYEKAHVQDLYRFTQDEANRPIAVRIAVPARPSRPE
jgi:hypothetical protein